LGIDAGSAQNFLATALRAGTSGSPKLIDLRVISSYTTCKINNSGADMADAYRETTVWPDGTTAINHT